jgi:tetratricopeptide (TPR) repeat protein
MRGPLLQGYDDFAHIGYVLFLDRYAALPWADQGWAYFHPPLHYLIGWAFAQFESAVILVRGLAFVSCAASLGIAALAAWVVRLALPERPGLGLLAFFSVGLLPVYLYSTNTTGNEMTAAFLATLGFSVFVANECQLRPTRLRAAWAGFAIGLAVLTKVSALLVLGAAGLALLAQMLMTQSRRDRVAVATRGVIIAGVVSLVAAPFFARNWFEYDAPSRLGTQFPDTARIEASQPPGSRSWLDFVYIPPGLFSNSAPDQEPLVHSVWGSAYAQTWADLRPAWNIIWQQRPIREARRAMLILGVIPTLLALAGGILAAADVRRGSHRRVYIPLLSLAAFSVLAFAGFAIAVPRFSATKATYLLGLTVPFAVFSARAIDALRTKPWIGRFAALAVVVAGIGSAVVNTHGWVVPPLRNQGSIAALQFYFGELDAAQRTSERWLRQRWFKTEWRDNLAAIALVRGHPKEAKERLVGDLPTAGASPFRWNSLAVATALAGDAEEAIAQFDAAIAAGAGEVGYANRGIVHAAVGDLGAAEADLREATRLDPELAPAWHAYAEVLARTGRADEAGLARSTAQRAAHATPRGHPYGIPDALAQRPEPGFAHRWLLRLDGDALSLAWTRFRHQ